MKKVILFALVLVVNGVLLNSVLAQEQRYVVTYVSSSTLTATRSATVVTVINQSSRACGVQVAWFVSPDPSRPACTQSTTLDPEEAGQFCSRGLPTSITTCNVPIVSSTCEPLTSQNQGKAIVSSMQGFECSLLAVEARVYYTTGETPPDMAISAISNSKIVFIGEGNLGD